MDIRKVGRKLAIQFIGWIAAVSFLVGWAVAVAVLAAVFVWWWRLVVYLFGWIV